MRIGPARWFCYLLACADGSLYTGITTSLERRLATHNAGSGSKYTRARRPVSLAWAEPCRDRSEASRREAAVKALPRAAKLALTRGRQATARTPRAAAGARRPTARRGRSGSDSGAPAATAAERRRLRAESEQWLAGARRPTARRGRSGSDSGAPAATGCRTPS